VKHRIMLRVSSGALGLVAVVAIAACGGGNKSSTNSSTSSTSSSSSSTSSSSSSSSKPGAGKPAVTLGDKNFPEEYLLGALYQQALQAKGYKITLKGNIGSTEVTDKALTSGKIDGYPEYTGTILSVLAGQSKVPPDAATTYSKAKAFEEGRGFTLTAATPFEDKDAIGTTKAFASKNGLKSISDLKKLGSSVTLGAAPEFRTREAGLLGLKKEYGLTQMKFKPLTIGLPYQGLDQGKLQAADVFTTDGQLTSGKYSVLTDPKNIFGFQNVAMVISKKVLAAEGPAFAQTIDAVSAKLTTPAVQAMNKAVVLDKQDPAMVAKQFLQANSLL
jgi:osmoprotectant transport system substrate-binding protein